MFSSRVGLNPLAMFSVLDFPLCRAQRRPSLQPNEDHLSLRRVLQGWDIEIITVFTSQCRLLPTGSLEGIQILCWAFFFKRKHNHDAYPMTEHTHRCV